MILLNTTERPLSLAGGGQGRFRRSARIYAFESTRLRHAAPSHLHIWYALYVVTEGAVTIRTSLGSWRATPGMSVLLAPYEVHTEEYDEREGCSYVGVFPLKSQLTALLGADGERMPEGFRASVTEDPVVASNIVSTWDAIRCQQPHAVARQIWQLVERLAERHQPLAIPRHSEPVVRAREYIHSITTGAPSLTEVANAARLSRFHFSRLFRDAVGVPPYTYFEHVRLARARLALHKGAGISRAAFAAGFSDQSHFTRHFAAQVGTTPFRYCQAVRAADSETDA
jgi:AraC-like DNA-binding protein